MSRPRRTRRLAAVLTASVALVSACGGAPEASIDPGERPDLPVASVPGGPFLPAVTVWDVGEQQWVQLADFLPADTPVLVWFWAPH